MRKRIAAATIALSAGFAGPALSQGFPTVDLESTSITQSFQTGGTGTRVDGVLLGQPAPVFSSTFSGTIASPAGQAAVTQAGAAVTAAAAPVRVRLSDPVLVGRVPSVQTINGTPTPILITGTNFSTSDPLTIPFGDRGVCASPGTAGALGDGGALPSGCQNNAPTTDVPLATGFVLTNTNTPQLVITSTTDLYQVTGTPIVQIGTSHALAPVSAFQSVDRLTDRILGELGEPSFFGTADRPWTAFAEAYGGYGHINADPGRLLPGARTEFGGMTGGFGGTPYPGIMVGWVVDVSRVDMATNDSFAPESSQLDLVKTGPFGSFRLGDLTIAFLGVGGHADTSTKSGSGAAGGVATAGYSMRVASGGGEISYDLRSLIGVSITPQFGYQYARIETDGFTETGSPFALQGLSNTLERQRVWFGAVWRETYNVGLLRVEPRAYLRAVNLSGDTDGGTNAIFTAFPGAGQVNLAGPQLDGWATQWGLRVRIPLLAGTAQISYDGQAGAGYNSQVFAARMRFAF